MTSPAITETAAEAALLQRAQAVLARAEHLLATAAPGAVTDKAREVIREHQRWLANSVDIHARLSLPESHPDRLHPADAYPSLAEGWPDDAKGQALALAADDMNTDTRVLAEVLRETFGEDALLRERSDEEGGKAA